ncbi:MAG: tetratricopeptide repeat protein [Caulobacteraceae bacterium]
MVTKAGVESLFVEAVRLHTAGRLDEADGAYRKVLQQDPNHAASLHGLGAIAHQGGRYERAVELISRAAAIDPAVAPYRSSLGNALKALGRPEEAEAAYRAALLIDAGDPVALNNFGNLLQGMGRSDEAIELYRRALELRPGNPVTHNNLGNALAALGRFSEAAALYERALALRPDYAEAEYNLANLRADEGRLDEAIARYRSALALRPDHLSARNNLGAVLRRAGRLVEAIACYDEVLARHPESAEAHSNLGRVFMLQGRLEEAGARYERALALKPDYREALVNLVLWSNYADCDPQTVFEAHRRWGEMVERGLPAPEPHANQRDPERRLRVGYVSPDFRTHSVAWFVAPLFASHDRAAVEIFSYADVPQPDGVTARLRALSDHWVSTVGMSDAMLAERVRADGIDILVDLAGHGGANLLTAFARRPAPVQVAWLGYVNTTGLEAMDYRLVDDITDPPGADAFATETLCGWTTASPVSSRLKRRPNPDLRRASATTW